MVSTDQMIRRELLNLLRIWAASVSTEETDNSAHEVQRRIEHRDPEGAGERRFERGCRMQARDQIDGVLQVDVPFRWAQGLGCPNARGILGRERTAGASVGRRDARQCHAEGRCCRKVATPYAKRAVAAHLFERHPVSQRRAYAVLKGGRFLGSV